MSSTAQFSFQDESPVSSSRKHRRNAAGGNGGGGSVGGTADTDNSSVAGSLTYSATSSVQSGGSAAGESTDSSFADILRAIDKNDAETTELAELTAKVGVGGANGPPTQIEARNRHIQGQTGRGAMAIQGRGMSSSSIASSLQYSMDGESYAGDVGGNVHPAVQAQLRQAQQKVQMSQVPQTITGQPSDSTGPDLGGLGAGDVARQRSSGGRSAGAASSSSHRTGGGGMSSRRSQLQRTKSDSSVGSNRSHRSSSSRGGGGGGSRKSSSSKSAPPPSGHNRRGSTGTPPTSPPPRARRREEDIEDLAGLAGGGSGEAWYSQWWMCGFSDALTKFGADPK